jgi:hypothetical protein
MSMAVRRVAVVLTVCLSAVARPAAAEEPAPDKGLNAAKEAFEAAQASFVRGDFAVAAEKFLAAYEAKPFPAFLFNVAVSYEKSKQLENAKLYFERYLEKDPNASDAAQVKLRLDVINKLLAPPPPPPPAPPPGTSTSPDGGAAPPATPPVGTPAPGGAPPPGAPLPPAVTPPPLVLPDIDTKGLVVIDSKPQGATIYLNDKRSGPFGKTPWQGSLESKPVRLLLEAKGWKPEERQISPRSDKLIDVYIALSEEHYLGWIEITSNVPGADVYIDRKDIGAIGRTPFTGHLKPGPHTITLERFGWEPLQQTIDVKPGTATQYTMTMKATEKGWVSVTGRGVSGGRLVIDDKLACATPCRAEVAPGRREVRVEHEGMEDYENKLDVGRGIETTIDVQLSPRPPRTKSISTAVVALVLIGGGVFVGHLSQQTKDSINADIAGGQLVDSSDSRFLRGKLEAIGADVLYGLGGIVAITAAFGFFSHGPDSAGLVDHRQISFSPSVGPGGGGVSLSGRFW